MHIGCFINAIARKELAKLKENRVCAWQVGIHKLLCEFIQALAHFTYGTLIDIQEMLVVCIDNIKQRRALFTHIDFWSSTGFIVAAKIHLELF
ncbi:hypothetical protein D3C87_1828900 [compost metagenome]